MQGSVHKTSGCKLPGKKHTTVGNDPTVPNNSIVGGNLRHTPQPFFLFVNGATAGTIPVLRRDLRYGAGTCMYRPRAQ